LRQSKKEERNRNKLAELFGLQEHLPTEATPTQQIQTNNKSREAEAVLAYVDEPKKFKQRPCKNCESVFAADRGNVAYCSDDCRKHALAQIGIIWDPDKDPRERWDFKMVVNDSGDSQLVNANVSREPLTVPPPALVVADLALEVQKDKESVSDTSSDPVVSETQTYPIVYDL